MWTLSRPIGTILVLFGIFLFSQSAEAKYGGGSGTAEDPYRIATAEELIALGETPGDYDKHFILTGDVELAGYVFDKAELSFAVCPTAVYAQIRMSGDPAFEWA